MPTSDDAHRHPQHASGHHGGPDSGHDPSIEQACAMAHGLVPPQVDGRRLVAVFASPVAASWRTSPRTSGSRCWSWSPTPVAPLPG